MTKEKQEPIVPTVESSQNLETQAMLKLIEQGEKEIAENKTVDARQAIRQIKVKLQLG